MSSSRNEKLLVAGVGLPLLGLLINYLLWSRTQLHSLHALYPYLTLSVILCGVLWARLRFIRLADEEQRDQASLAAQKPGSSLFSGQDEELDPISFVHARAQFEKWFVPALAPALAVLIGYWGYRLYPPLGTLIEEAQQRFFAAAVLFGQSFVLFLFGRFFLGLGRLATDRLLRGAGTILLLTSLATVLAAAAAMVGELAWPPADLVVRRVLSIYLWILAIEFVVNTIAYLYRPKRKGEWVTTYESRISALLTDPKTWTSSLAQTLDYQFGFQVSETGFYRFLRRALLPLLFVQALLLYALSAIVVLGPEEEGILERFGNPLDEAGTPRYLHSGVHFKWPWPFETVRRHPTRRILTAHVGFEKDPSDPRPPLMVWTRPHYLSEESFIVASRDLMAADLEEDDTAVPVNFVTVNVGIEYQITNLFQYVYVNADADALLQLAAHRVVTRELARRDLIELLGPQRQDAGQNIFAALQAAADELELGVEILFLGLHGAHPPIPVAAAFESVIGSLEERETAILESRAYRNRTLPMAAAEADELTWEAQADRARRVDIAAAEAELFQTRLALHNEMPRVYASRLYLETLQRALAPIRKYVVAASPDLEVIILNYEERIRPELFDFGPGMMEERFL